MLDYEVTLDSVLFDPSVRDELTAFFAKALHSDYRQRFDNAEEMLQAWRRMFESVDRPITDTDNGSPADHAEALAGATEETQLSTLGLSPRLLDALDRLNGTITNDKFCCTRWSTLQLSWWRRPLRLRH
jgi:hypothetical protein